MAILKNNTECLPLKQIYEKKGAGEAEGGGIKCQDLYF